MTNREPEFANDNADYKVVRAKAGEHYLFYAGNHRLFKITSELAGKLEDADLSLDDTEIYEWKKLQAMGAFASNNAHLLSEKGRVDEQNLAVNLNLTGECNLNCSYCFADGGDYGRIGTKMSPGLIPKIFEFIVNNHTKTKVVRFEFFGGEPLLNLPFIEEIVAKSRELEERHGLTFINRISTNLTVLPKGAIELFDRHKFIVSVSIDGGEATQNANRPMKSGKGSYRKIIEHCRAIREQCRNVTLVARMTVARGASRLTSDVKDLWALNLFDYFQIYPGLEVPKNRVGRADASEVPVEFYGGISDATNTYIGQFKELMAIYPTLFQENNRFKGVLECQYIAQMIVQGKAAIRRCGAGDTYYTISPDGSISPCHRLVGERKFDVDGHRNGIHGDAGEWLRTVDENDACARCWGRYICGGNCRQENYVRTGSLHNPNKEACAYQLAMLEEMIRITPFLVANDNVFDPVLDDLFVSCGQPVLDNGRKPIIDQDLKHIVPLFDESNEAGQ